MLSVKARVDRDACTGCGLCCDTCPEVFEMDNDVARVLMDDIPPDLADKCREAAEGCPVEAIQIEE
jgi:ferredoxin